MTECLNACHNRSSLTPSNAFYSAGIQAFCHFCRPGRANRVAAGACLRNPQACLQACLKHACRPQASACGLRAKDGQRRESCESQRGNGDGKVRVPGSRLFFSCVRVGVCRCAVLCRVVCCSLEREGAQSPWGEKKQTTRKTRRVKITLSPIRNRCSPFLAIR